MGNVIWFVVVDPFTNCQFGFVKLAVCHSFMPVEPLNQETTTLPLWTEGAILS